jgi:hypothetical protein
MTGNGSTAEMSYPLRSELWSGLIVKKYVSSLPLLSFKAVWSCCDRNSNTRPTHEIVIRALSGVNGILLQAREHDYTGRIVN